MKKGLIFYEVINLRKNLYKYALSLVLQSSLPPCQLFYHLLKLNATLANNLLAISPVSRTQRINWLLSTGRPHVICYDYGLVLRTRN